MAGVSIEVTIQDEAVRRQFAYLVRVMDDTTPLMAAIGTGLVASTHRRFLAQVSPEGAGWAPVHPSYRPLKRNSRILTESGRLAGSINPQASKDHVVVGTNVIYAAIHQFGGTIEPKSASHLVFRLASGVVLANSVTLPARPFLGISADDEEMIGDEVEDFVQRRAN